MKTCDKITLQKVHGRAGIPDVPPAPLLAGKKDLFSLAETCESKPRFFIAMKYDKKADPFYLSPAWRAVREQALLRDHWCRECLRLVAAGIKPRPNEATMVHHVKPRKLYPELELELDNLESLCNDCHAKMHPERGFRKRLPKPSARRCVVITNEMEKDCGDG